MTIQEHLLKVKGPVFDVVVDEDGNFKEFLSYDSDDYISVQVLAQQYIKSEEIFKRKFSIYDISGVCDRNIVNTRVCVDLNAREGYFLKIS